MDVFETGYKTVHCTKFLGCMRVVLAHYSISHNLVLQYKPVLDIQSDWMCVPSSMLVHSSNFEMALL